MGDPSFFLIDPLPKFIGIDHRWRGMMKESANSTLPDRATRPKRRSQPRASLAVRIVITALLLVAFGVHMNGVKIDEVGVMLLVLATIPWLGLFLDAAELFGMKFRFGKIEQKQEQIVAANTRMEKQQKEIADSFTWLNELTGLMIGEAQQLHLRNIVDGEFSAKFYDDSPFEDELRHLMAIGMLERKNDKGFRSLSKEAHSNMDHSVNIGNHLKITEQGRRYLRLRANEHASKE